MLTFQSKQFQSDGEPILILAGEVHYFRLPPDTWEMHLKRLKSSGCNTVSAYVPWLCHEEKEGEFDFDGHTVPQLNLIRFLELAQNESLFVFLRPGPFVMAELKNEGLPFWLYEKYPEIVPKTWDAKPVPTHTVDYLAKPFLEKTKIYYTHFLNAVKSFLQQNGGPIVGIQLDNEVGMLSWVSNAPDLSTSIFTQLKAIFPRENPYAPGEECVLSFRESLGYLMRKRMKAYLEILKSMFVDLGVKDMPFFINIHGTSHGKGHTFPIGISQLLESYSDNDLIPGTDVYYGNLDIETFHDFYTVNAFTEATISNNQPLTSLEFGVGDGNYGDNLGTRKLPSASDFKLRMSIAQNHKMINYYLWTGGFNYKLKYPVGKDGNDRIAFTGERHGFAAPVQPDGSLNYTYDRLAKTTRMMRNLGSKLGTMFEDHDDIYIGFIADYFMTEYTYPSSVKLKAFHENIVFHRSSVFWDTLIKQMLLLHHRPKAIHMEKENLDPGTHKIIVLGVAQYLSRTLQEKLVDYLKKGGKLLLVGEVPVFDMHGNRCTVLSDALDVKVKKTYHEREYENLSINFIEPIRNAYEFRTHYAQAVETKHPAFFHHSKTNEKIGFFTDNVVFITSRYPGYTSITKHFLDHLGAFPKLLVSGETGHLFMTESKNEYERFLHIMNLDHFDQAIQLSRNGLPLFEGKTLDVFAQEAMMLPINLHIDDIIIEWSTAELIDYGKDFLHLRLTQEKDEIQLITKRVLLASENYMFDRKGDRIKITSRHHAKVNSYLKLQFKL